MNEIVAQFLDVIQSSSVIQERQDSKIVERKLRVVFIDGSILEYTEILIHDINKRKYAFQWMDSTYNLLIRWDNASHHRHISTFPHHKHVGDEKTILESFDVSLLEVLTEINSQLR